MAAVTIGRKKMKDTNNNEEYSLTFQKAVDDSTIGKLLRGSIDTHVHFAPQPGGAIAAL